MREQFKELNKRKIVAILLAIFMIVPILYIFVVSASSSGDVITIFTEDSGLVVKMRHNGTNVGTSDAWYKGDDGVNYPAYCVEPSKPGVGESGGSYDVTLSDTITDPKVYGIILAGYPYKTLEELGLPNAWEAAFATKFALKIYLENQAGTRNVAGWSALNADNQYMYDAIMSIYNAGIKNTVIPPAPTVTVIAAGGNAMTEQDIDGEIYFVKEYTVTSNVAIKSYTVSIKGSKPTDTIIAAVNGTSEKTTFNAGEKFRVLVPKTSVTNSGSLTLDVKGEVENHRILYGTSFNAGTQDYAITAASVTFKNAGAYATFEQIPTTEPVTEPTTTPETTTETTTEAPQNGSLEINKYKSGTIEGLTGAVFEIRNSAGTVVSIVSTDGSGKITLILPVGIYSVTEITPPDRYALDEDAHKDNIIIYSDSITSVAFSNKELSKLEVTKVDADTGAILSGATIRLAKDGGTQSFDAVTNALGVAVFDNIEAGTYTVKEIIAPAGYILDSTPHIIVLEAGRTSTITLKNKSKPGLIIRKYDENTGLLLGGAEFSVSKMSGQIVYEGITPDSGADLGTVRMENLEEGWYKVTELAAPAGYLIATESKDVFLPAGKTVEIKFDNRKRPSLRITKVDAMTNEPLAGAKFKIQKTENATVSEYVTNASGEIVISDLDEAIYSI